MVFRFMPPQAQSAHGFRKSFKWHKASPDFSSHGYDASEKTGGGSWNSRTASGPVGSSGSYADAENWRRPKVRRGAKGVCCSCLSLLRFAPNVTSSARQTLSYG